MVTNIIDAKYWYVSDAHCAAVDTASRESAQFKADCKDMLAWVGTAADRLDSADPISSDPEALKQQARNNRVSFLWTE
jgi:hypothetical protein